MFDHGFSRRLQRLHESACLDKQVMASLVAASLESSNTGGDVLEETGNGIDVVGADGDGDVDGGLIAVDAVGSVGGRAVGSHACFILRFLNLGLIISRGCAAGWWMYAG